MKILIGIVASLLVVSARASENLAQAMEQSASVSQTVVKLSYENQAVCAYSQSIRSVFYENETAENTSAWTQFAACFANAADMVAAQKELENNLIVGLQDPTFYYVPGLKAIMNISYSYVDGVAKDVLAADYTIK